MPFAELLITTLAAALLLTVAGVPRHPRWACVLAWVYSSALLILLTKLSAPRLAVYALATGFVALVLSRLVSKIDVESNPASFGVSKLRSRIPRL